MQKKWLVALTFLVITNAAHALNFDFMAGGGFRKDRFHWSISDPEGDPDILSELSWNNLCMYDLMAMFKGSFLGFEVKLKGDYGHILSGKNRDSDYLESGRKMENSRSISDVRGHAYDVSAAVGYHWSFCIATIEPLAGWSHHELRLKDSNGWQIINWGGPTGKIRGLHSGYRARWDGPWVGLDATCSLLCDWIVYGTFEYHWLYFRGTGNWNLRPDFMKDFQQRAFGHGTLFTLGTQYELFCKWYFGLEYNLVNMTARNGTDRIFTIFGNGSTRLREASWHSMSILGTVSFLF